jgi:hypothetical protein
MKNFWPMFATGISRVRSRSDAIRREFVCPKIEVKRDFLRYFRKITGSSGKIMKLRNLGLSGTAQKPNIDVFSGEVHCSGNFKVKGQNHLNLLY